MSVKIRLTRMGKKKQPTYRVVVMDSRKPRDGAYIEQIGRYDPRAEPSVVEIDNDKALMWLQRGAQPTDRAKKLLEISGAWTRFRVAKGDIHTVGEAATAPATPEPVFIETQPEPEPEATEMPAPEPVPAVPLADAVSDGRAAAEAEVAAEAAAEEAEAVVADAESAAGDESGAGESAEDESDEEEQA